jgi:hypothetical protein
MKDFFGSMTSLQPERLGASDTARILAALGLDANTLAPGQESGRLMILRHTLMNPYLLDAQHCSSYIDRYFEFLSGQIHALTRADAA